MLNHPPNIHDDFGHWWLEVGQYLSPLDQADLDYEEAQSYRRFAQNLVKTVGATMEDWEKKYYDGQEEIDALKKECLGWEEKNAVLEHRLTEANGDNESLQRTIESLNRDMENLY